MCVSRSCNSRTRTRTDGESAFGSTVTLGWWHCIIIADTFLSSQSRGHNRYSSSSSLRATDWLSDPPNHVRSVAIFFLITPMITQANDPPSPGPLSAWPDSVFVARIISYATARIVYYNMVNYIMVHYTYILLALLLRLLLLLSLLMLLWTLRLRFSLPLCYRWTYTPYISTFGLLRNGARYNRLPRFSFSSYVIARRANSSFTFLVYFHIYFARFYGDPMVYFCAMILRFLSIVHWFVFFFSYICLW